MLLSLQEPHQTKHSSISAVTTLELPNPHFPVFTAFNKHELHLAGQATRFFHLLLASRWFIAIFHIRRPDMLHSISSDLYICYRHATRTASSNSLFTPLVRRKFHSDSFDPNFYFGEHNPKYPPDLSDLLHPCACLQQPHSVLIYFERLMGLVLGN